MVTVVLALTAAEDHGRPTAPQAWTMQCKGKGAQRREEKKRRDGQMSEQPALQMNGEESGDG